MFSVANKPLPRTYFRSSFLLVPARNRREQFINWRKINRAALSSPSIILTRSSPVEPKSTADNAFKKRRRTNERASDEWPRQNVYLFIFLFRWDFTIKIVSLKKFMHLKFHWIFAAAAAGCDDSSCSFTGLVFFAVIFLMSKRYIHWFAARLYLTRKNAVGWTDSRFPFNTLIWHFLSTFWICTARETHRES